MMMFFLGPTVSENNQTMGFRVIGGVTERKCFSGVKALVFFGGIGLSPAPHDSQHAFFFGVVLGRHGKN